MSFSHRIVVSYTGGSSSISFTDTQTWGGEANLDETIPASSDGLEVAWALADYTTLKSLLITADAEMTIYTNADAGGADDTFSVGPSSGIVFWTTELQADGAAVTNPISANVTSIFVDSTAGGELQIRSSYDPS